jgi:DNA-binding response OmpR family regulator
MVVADTYRWSGATAMPKDQKTVLIVEKQPNYTQQLVKQVMFAGLTPIVAVTGEGGFRKAIEFHPDLILLELDLTDMDGLELVELLKERPIVEKIPIVAMSIFSYMKFAALYEGCDDFLKKPIRMIDLMAHVRRFVHKSGSVQSRQPGLQTFSYTVPRQINSSKSLDVLDFANPEKN